MVEVCQVGTSRRYYQIIQNNKKSNFTSETRIYADYVAEFKRWGARQRGANALRELGKESARRRPLLAVFRKNPSTWSSSRLSPPPQQSF